MKNFDVIIIGAGAAGLYCALTAGQRGRSVLVIEHANKVGKKILISGGGRCNFTNLEAMPTDYLSGNPHFCKSALKRFTQWDFVQQVQRHHIDYEQRKWGQLFCKGSSRDILNMLLDECRQSNVEIVTDCSVSNLTNVEGFEVATSHGDFGCDSLVVATGGLSFPRMGASGFGYDIARQFGLSVRPTRAALVPFTFNGEIGALTNRLSGVSLEATITAGASNTAFSESLLFTHRGLSGIGILQASNYWEEGQDIRINLLPGEDISERLLTFKQQNPSRLMRTVLPQVLPKKLVLELETLWWKEHAELPLQQWSNKALQTLADRLGCWSLKPSGTEGYRTAEVTLGGVDTDGLSSKTMESKAQKGLYFIGEVVDVTGHLGGFNFQWAWSSGYAAGQVV